MWVTLPGANGLPSKAVTVRGAGRESVEIWRFLARVTSMKFPAAPESIKAWSWCFLPPQVSVMGRDSPVLEGEAVRVTPVTVLPCLCGTGRFPRVRDKSSENDPAVHNIDSSALSYDGHALKETVGPYPTAWVLESLGALIAFEKELDWQTVWKQTGDAGFVPSGDYLAGLLDQ